MKANRVAYLLTLVSIATFGSACSVAVSQSQPEAPTGLYESTPSLEEPTSTMESTSVKTPEPTTEPANLQGADSVVLTPSTPPPANTVAFELPSETLEEPEEEAPAEPELVRVRVVVKPKIESLLPRGSRIVLTNIDGACNIEVRDALMRRLVDNTDYIVVTRDFLSQILEESESSWAGSFNTDTAAQLGDLLAASAFVVGRVAFCGSSKGSGPESFSIQAILQILDIRTGKVLVSSSAEGTYTQASARLLKSTLGSGDDDETAASPEENPQEYESESEGSEDPDDQGTKGKKGKKVNYPAFKAAENMANGFADKFFARPTWEDVTMWTSPTWRYDESIGYVKLGHCQKAVDLLNDSAYEIRSMPPSDVANYLHNYGIALLCNNQLESAVAKLRAAYRVSYDPSTLAMIELASRIEEWSLVVETDSQPEIDHLAKRVENACL